jgi:hypothetical protein
MDGRRVALRQNRIDYCTFSFCEVSRCLTRMETGFQSSGELEPES